MGIFDSINFRGRRRFGSNSSLFIGKNNKYEYNEHDRHFPLNDGFANTLDAYSIISRITQKAKEIPVQVVQGEDDEIVTSGALFEIVNTPSKLFTRSEFFELGMTFLLASGNVIGFLDAPIGFSPEQIVLLYPQHIILKTKIEDKQVVPLSYEYILHSKRFTNIPPELISHIRNVNPTNFGLHEFWGLSPLQAAFLTVISSHNLDTANASILENRGAIGILSNESEILLTPEEAEKHQERLNKKLGNAADFNKIIQSGAKVKYQPIGMSPADLKIVESRVMKLRDMCNAYHADSSLFNDPANKIKANRIDANRSFYSDAVIPVLNKYLTIFNPIIKRESEIQGKQFKLKLDLSDIAALQEDQSKKADRAKKTSSAIISILAANITQSQKIESLIEALQISPERAATMVGNEQTFSE